MDKRSIQQIRYVAGDFLATNVAWMLFNIVRYHMLPARTGSFASLRDYLMSPVVALGQLVFPLLMLGIYWLSGYYNNVFYKSRIEELNTTFTTTLSGALIIFFTVLLNDMSNDLTQDWALLGVMFGLLFGLVYGIRCLLTAYALQRLRSGSISFSTLLIGNPADAAQFMARSAAPRFMGLKVTAVATDSPDSAGAIPAGIDLITDSSIEEYVAACGIERIVVLPDPAVDGKERMLRLFNRLLPLDVKVLVSPDEFQMLMSRPKTTNIVGDPLIDITRSELTAPAFNAKRVGDVAVSALALLLLSPLLAAIAIAVKADSPGPAFYRQRRIGYHKHPFDIIKFRTMTTDAEAEGPQLSQGDNDPRITRLGRLLRKYRLDELPQFWNVLRGEMSLVGPRPEREHYIVRIMERAPYYSLLHQVRPGITSWGMVRYGYAANVDQMVERLKYDLLYLENVSFAVDMKIVFYTVSTVIKGKGQ